MTGKGKDRAILRLAALFAVMLSFVLNASPVVHVGFSTEDPVAVSTRDTGRGLSGYSYEFLQTIASHTGWECEYVPYDRQGLLGALKSGEVDMALNISMYEKDAAGVLVPESDSAYIDYSFYTLPERNVGTDLHSATIGVLGEVVPLTILDLWGERHNVAVHKAVYPTREELYEALEKGDVDMVLDNEFDVLDECIYVSFANYDTRYVAFALGRQDLVLEFDDAVESIYSVSPSYLEDLFNDYYSREAVKSSLSADEKSWIDSHDKLVCGLVQGTAFYHKDKDGSIESILPGILEEILAKVGVENMGVEYITYEYYEDLEKALADGTIDVGFPFYKDVYAADIFGYDTVCDIKPVALAAISHMGMGPQDARTIAVADNSVCKAYVLANYPSARLVVCETWEDCLNLVKKGEADSSIATMQIAQECFSANSNLGGLEAMQLSRTLIASVAVKHGNSSLYKLLARGNSLLDKDFVSATLAGYNVVQAAYSYRDFLRNNMGAVIAIVLIVLSLTAVIIIMRYRKVKDEQLTAERERYLNVVKGLSSRYFCVFHVEPEKNIGTCYRAAPYVGETFGFHEGKQYEYTTAVEHYITHGIDEGSRDMIRSFLSLQNIREMLAGGQNISSLTYIVSRFGQDRYFQATVARVDEVDMHGFVLGFGDVDDIVRKEQEQQSKLKDALSRAEAANKSKSTFLTNMSHDIRTPMNAIIGFTTLAAESLDDREQMADYLSKIRSSGNHLMSLINAILDMSRIESGKIMLVEKEASLPEIFRTIRDIMSQDIVSKDLSLHIDTQGVAHEDIYCDALRLSQVIINCLGNAAKFTPAGGEVSVTIMELPSLNPERGLYRFVVKDTGIGMKKEFLEHVFEPFERERSSTVSGIQGTGLGMAITKHLVTLMDGDISVESEEGVGTEISILLDFRLQKKETLVQLPPRFDGRKALVVFQCDCASSIVSNMLKKMGMESVAAKNTEEAVALASSDVYPLVILDDSPETKDAIQRLKETKGAGGAFMVLASYNDDAGDTMADAVWTRPLFASVLHSIITSSTIGGASEEKHDGKVRMSSRILLVEDNMLNSEIAKRIMENAGLEVETAWNGEEAVAKVEEHDGSYYSVILMDIQMPVMDGYEATRRIRGLSDNIKASVPIIAMTANAFEEDKKLSYEAGMNGHLSKPFDVEDLWAAIDRVGR